DQRHVKIVDEAYLSSMVFGNTASNGVYHFVMGYSHKNIILTLVFGNASSKTFYKALLLFIYPRWRTLRAASLLPVVLRHKSVRSTALRSKICMGGDQLSHQNTNALAPVSCSLAVDGAHLYFVFMGLFQRHDDVAS